MDRGARDAAGTSSHLIDRRPGVRGGKGETPMLKAVGREAVVDEEVDGASLLDEIAREGARRMLLAAFETEVAAYLEANAADRDGNGHALDGPQRQGSHTARHDRIRHDRRECPSGE